MSASNESKTILWVRRGLQDHLASLVPEGDITEEERAEKKRGQVYIAWDAKLWGREWVNKRALGDIVVDGNNAASISRGQLRPRRTTTRACVGQARGSSTAASSTPSRGKLRPRRTTDSASVEQARTTGTAPKSKRGHPNPSENRKKKRAVSSSRSPRREQDQEEPVPDEAPSTQPEDLESDLDRPEPVASSDTVTETRNRVRRHAVSPAATESVHDQDSGDVDSESPRPNAVPSNGFEQGSVSASELSTEFLQEVMDDVLETMENDRDGRGNGDFSYHIEGKFTILDVVKMAHDRLERFRSLKTDGMIQQYLFELINDPKEGEIALRRRWKQILQAE